MTPWLLMQLADSALPTGGFAHSGGLEAAWQQGFARDLRAWVRDVLWQAGHGALPLASCAFEDPAQLARLDARCETFMAANAVARRASELQGRAFLATCQRVFPETAQLRGTHFAPVFGAVFRTLRLELRDMQQVLLFNTARGALQAAVRLGAVGTHEAQRVQREAPYDEVLAACSGLRVVVQTAPLVDLLGATHDALYSRLFQS